MTASAAARDVLDAHRPVWITVTGSDAFTAACYAPGCDFGDGTEDEYRAHLADVLAPLLEEEAAADAWDEGFGAGEDYGSQHSGWGKPPPNPHRGLSLDPPPPEQGHMVGGLVTEADPRGPRLSPGNPHRARREDAADEGYVCEDCGCWNPTGQPCKYAAEHIEDAQ